MKQVAAQSEAGHDGVAREFLTFRLGPESYGIEILKVQEIRGYEKVTPIPSAPAYLKGVVNLRGHIVPVIDLRMKFGMAEPRYDSFTVVVILRLAQRVIGVVVDGVSDTLPLLQSDIKAAPALGALVDASYLGGLATRDGRMILLLDIERFLSSAELNLLAAATAGAPGRA